MLRAIPRPIILLIGLIAFILLCWWSVSYHHAPSIPDDVQNRTQQAINAAGFESVHVGVDGRDIILQGSVLDVEARKLAEGLAEQVRGVRVVDNQLQIMAAESEILLTEPQAGPEVVKVELQTQVVVLESIPYQLLAEYKGNAVVLSGTVVDQDESNRIFQRTKQLFRNLPVSNVLEIGAEPLAAGNGLVAVGLQQLSGLITGQMVLGIDFLRLDGSVASLSEQRSIQTIMTAAQDNVSDFSVIATLSVAQSFDNTACQNKLNSLINSDKIQFAYARADISEDSYFLLDRLAAVGQRCVAMIEIGGHTDTTGDEALNQALSEERALSVQRYLQNKGVPAERLMAVGYGEEYSIGDNTTQAGRAKNRRIEFQVLEKQ